MTKQFDSDPENWPQPIDGELGATDEGPRDVMRDKENPDMSVPPRTDSGTFYNLKFSYSDTHRRMEKGGWSREVTIRELPAAEDLAGVNMRLTAGGVRELHWHKEAEWAYMINGTARVTCIDPEGHSYIDDVAAGGLWYFPAGFPHSIKGLTDCEFLLIFDDGQFSENSTFLLSDFFAHIPKRVLAKNFGVDESAFDNIPDSELYIYQGDVPGSIEEEQPKNRNGQPPKPFTFNLFDQEPIKTSGGKVWIADSSNFEVSKTVAIALVELEPGGVRELHWHPNGQEWQYWLQGQGVMGVYNSAGQARHFNYREGDVGLVPYAAGHYIENTGDETLRFIEAFKSDRFADLSVNQWLSQVPARLVKEHLGVDDDFIDNALCSEKRPNVKFD